MLNPSPVLMNMGSSTRSMYQPKLLRVCVTIRAQKGTEVKIAFQGTASLGVGYKNKTQNIYYIKYL
jgi:hypothetical protein